MLLTGSVFELLNQATNLLSAVSDTPRLEAEILLADVLGFNRAQLFANTDFHPNNEQLIDFTSKIDVLLSGVPFVYLRGTQAFWSLSFEVTSDVLIPRPETELLVETVLALKKSEKISLADLGTGSGAIAISLAHERPDWEIHATDKSQNALQIAQKNAIRLQTKKILFHLGDWFDALSSEKKFDVIVSNPPYIDKNDVHLKNCRLQHEPKIALISENKGLADLQKIIFSSVKYMKNNGWLLVEHGFDQAIFVREFFQMAGYVDVHSLRDLAGHERVTLGCLVSSLV